MRASCGLLRSLPLAILASSVSALAFIDAANAAQPPTLPPPTLLQEPPSSVPDLYVQDGDRTVKAALAWSWWRRPGSTPAGFHLPELPWGSAPRIAPSRGRMILVLGTGVPSLTMFVVSSASTRFPKAVDKNTILVSPTASALGVTQMTTAAPELHVASLTPCGELHVERPGFCAQLPASLVRAYVAVSAHWPSPSGATATSEAIWIFIRG